MYLYITGGYDINISSEHLDTLYQDHVIIPNEFIRFMDCIGQGNTNILIYYNDIHSRIIIFIGEFGIVYKAHLIGPMTKYQPVKVAVKTLKGMIHVHVHTYMYIHTYIEIVYIYTYIQYIRT